MCLERAQLTLTILSYHITISAQGRASRPAQCIISFFNLSHVGRGRHVTTASGPVNVDVLALGVVLVGVLRLDAEGVSTEVVTLSLQQVGGEVLGAVSVVEAEGSAESGGRDTPESTLADNISPAALGLGDGGLEEVVEEKVLKVGVAAVGVGDILEKDGADDTATTPHEGNGRLVKLPAVLAGSLLDEHEALGIGDDLRGIQGLLQIIDESLLVTGELRSGATEKGAGAGTLVLESTQATREDSLADQGDGHAKVKSVNGSPLAGTLLASLIKDLLNERCAIVVVVLEDIASDFDQEGVQDTLVPLLEDFSDLANGHSHAALEDIIGLADELHVTIFNTIVDHLDEVTGTLITDPVAASLAVALGGNTLEDVLDVGPGGLVTTGHERGTITSTLLTTGDTATNEADALLGKVLGTAVAVGEVGVTTIDDDITLLEVGQKRLNKLINGLSSHDQEHDTTGTLQLSAELLNGVSTNNGLALSLVGKEAVDLGGCAVESANSETVISSVKDQVLAHDGQTDQTEVSTR